MKPEEVGAMEPYIELIVNDDGTVSWKLEGFPDELCKTIAERLNSRIGGFIRDPKKIAPLDSRQADEKVQTGETVEERRRENA
jgi:hypothetical protein